MTITEQWNDTELLESEQGFAVTTLTPAGFDTNFDAGFDAVDEPFERADGAMNSDDEAVTETPVSFGTSDLDRSWELQAACRNVENSADLFFSEELADIVAAKQICTDCPVIAPCLEGAITRAEPCGVWGGQLFSNGRVLMQKRRRGRPPKVARPEDQLPVVPVPEHLQKLIA